MDTDTPEVIFTYTRSMALADGAIVELDRDLVREAGFRCPVAVSARVYAQCIALTPQAKAAGCDVTGRTWDVLWMLATAARKRPVAADGARVDFALYCVQARRAAQLTKLYAVISGDDDGAPCVTVMFPDED